MMKRLLCALLAALLSGMVCAGIGEANSFTFSDVLPKECYTAPKNCGKVEPIAYPSRDYAGDGSEITKHALIYLPYGYSETSRYDVLVLCHGVGGTENEWGFRNQYCIGRNIVDRLIDSGEVSPFIVVCPNGRSSADCYNTSMNNASAFYDFGQELRNDLLPYIDAHYATHGSDTPDDLSASREHRSIAGLSMGGMQTINIGLCECLDLFSAFGAFSAAPTSYTSPVIAEKLEAFPDTEVRYFYSICGTQDGIAYQPAYQAAGKLPENCARFSDSNWHWHEKKGTHSFDIWNLGLYNFVKLLGTLENAK